MPKSNVYWKKRFEAIEAASNSYGQEVFRQIESTFDAALRQIEGQIHTWYGRFADNNNITMQEARKLLNSKELKEFKWDVQEYIKYGHENDLNHLWMKELENASAKFHISRLEALKVRTQQAAEVAFGNELDAVDKMARKVFTEDYYHSIFEMQKGFNIGWEIGQLDEEKLSKLISKPWAADGKHFSDRIWSSRTQLVSELHSQLTRACILGKTPDDAIKAISKKFKTSKSQAGRLVMTEQAYFHSVAQQEAFKELEVEEFEIVATLDSETSQICQEMDGKHFPMKDYEAGVTAPPFHPWCRSVTVPWFEDNFTGERAARSEEGKTYYVPDNMKYSDWKQSMVDGQTDGLQELPEQKIKSVVPEEREFSSKPLKEIVNELKVKHERILKNDAQKDEFSDIIVSWEKDKANLYNKMTDNFSSNRYYEKGTGWYSPSAKRIEMDMDSNEWEVWAERNSTGAWKTKFHEEMHQLDHILASQKSKFSLIDGTTDSFDTFEFTNPKTVTGKKMIQAIDDDVLELINTAIDWDVETNGVAAKHIKGLNRISSDAKDATIRYLRELCPTKKDKALIDTVTDAIGMTTKGNLHPYSKGFWGHDKAYCSQTGKSGATSEAWANLAGFMMRGDTEALEAVAKLMPKTVSTYQEIFDEVVEYAKLNPIHY